LDMAGKQYWNRVWAGDDVQNTIDPREPNLRDHVFGRFHEYFLQLFSKMETSGKKLLEIGCARSAWLPYFAKEFGFNVSGIDYSDTGCSQAEQLLLKAGVEGKVICGNFFFPPDHFIEAFDVVISFGVVEHFRDTSGCLRAFSRFLKAGGLLFTNLPNLVGLNGMIQKIVNRPVFDVHVPLDKDDLARAHDVNGLQTISCHYFLFLHLGVLNIENWRGGILYFGAFRLRSLISRIAWRCEKAIPFMRPNRWSSPYINCLAVKAEGSRDGSLSSRSK
jgi:2-polyprenyl-3-methyl-5-hydroxy-6-metoxy-1,4-benzoquinol methylase